MAEYSETPKASILRYLLVNVALPIMLFYALNVVGYVAKGIYENYQNKKSEVLSLAKVLAHSAAYDDPELIISQVNLSMHQHSAVEDIQFYSIEHAIELNKDTYNDWRKALFRRSESFHQEVVVGIEESQTNKVHIEHGADHSHAYALAAGQTRANTALIGYINITLDLQDLRQQWFKRHYIMLITIMVIWFILLIIIYIRLLPLLKSFFSMVNQAKQVASQDEVMLDKFIHSDKRFIELDVINQLITKLDNRYKILQADFEHIKKKEFELQNKKHITSHSSNFQSMIIHELKSSLNDMSDGLQLIGNGYLSDEQAAAVAVIRKGNSELDFTLNQIIQLNRIEKGQLGISYSELQPAQMINSLIQTHETQALKKGLTLRAHIHHVDSVLAGDVKKTQTILDELVLNAIKFTQTGRVTIDSSMMYFVDSIRWTIKVSDTGNGIENKYLEDVFIPFFQVSILNGSNQEGPGVGLGIAQKLTELLGGSLTVESEVGVGSTFTLVLQLRSWHHNELFTLLKGIKIAALESEGSETVLKGLETYGAKIDMFTDKFALIERIIAKPSDVLLISDKVAASTVVKICKSIRNQETSHRILIIWYHSNIENHELAELEAVGLDYVLNSAKAPKAQASMIRSWIMGSALD